MLKKLLPSILDVRLFRGSKYNCMTEFLRCFTIASGFHNNRYVMLGLVWKLKILLRIFLILRTGCGVNATLCWTHRLSETYVTHTISRESLYPRLGQGHRCLLVSVPWQHLKDPWFHSVSWQSPEDRIDQTTETSACIKCTSDSDYNWIHQSQNVRESLWIAGGREVETEGLHEH